ncbi:MAG: winged helix-turn-helix transcriptional regulator [Spirochaetales bacterium]|nr:winged helix-turn-helix transcriptional regulator [Spirochaetales bacterium]
MTENEKHRSEARAKILKALAHPSRMFIVEKIRGKPHCVCELAEMIGIDQSTTSKHLSVLKNAGIIEDRKEGTTVYYSLRCGCIMDFIGCIEHVIRMNLERDYKFLKSVGKNG